MENPVSSTETVFKVILFSDIVGSTELKVALGDALGAEAISLHDTTFRRCLPDHGGTELSHAGDGFFATFDVPSAALRFAFSFLDELSRLPISRPITVRIGINIGEIVFLAHGGTGGAQDKLVGLAVDLGSRVMSLAEGGQILLTRAVFDSSRQQMTTAPDGSPIVWLAHGNYLFKGIADPQEIFEAGVEGRSPLRAPAGSEKASRVLSPGEEETLGWRPAAGLIVPGRDPWRLERKLGEGGFGEVWVANNHLTREARTFKFCFRSDRLRTLKRELTLFRLIKDVLGERPDIARLYDVQLEKSPYFLEMEYTDGGDMETWSDGRGGAEKVPLTMRLELAAQVADALAAAHSVGVIHKDVKPRNILIHERKDGTVQARLTDFGIGQVLAASPGEALLTPARENTGRSSTVLTDLGSRTGTRLYMAPEVLAGGQPSIQSDIYALGVLLYQLVTADLHRPLAVGWERDVEDELLREDIRMCVDGTPARRLRSAAELSERLRSLDARRAALEAERRAQAEMEKAHRRRKLFAGASFAGLLIAIVGSVIAVRESRLRRRAEQETAKATAIKDFLVRIFEAPDPAIGAKGANVTAKDLLEAGEERIDEDLAGQPEVQATLLNIIGSTLYNLGLYEQSLRPAMKAEAIQKASPGESGKTLFNTKLLMAAGLINLRDSTGAEKAINEALQIASTLKEGHRQAEAYALFYRSLLSSSTGDRAQEEESGRKALEIIREVQGKDSAETSRYLMNFGQTLRAMGRTEESERVQRANLELLLRERGEDHFQTAMQMNSLAIVLMNRGNKTEARSLYERALAVQRLKYGDAHRRTGVTLGNYIRTCETDEEFKRAEQLVNEMIGALERDHPKDIQGRIALLGSLRSVYFRWKKTDEVARVEAMVEDLRRSHF